jgi:hypothetical protein
VTTICGLAIRIVNLLWKGDRETTVTFTPTVSEKFIAPRCAITKIDMGYEKWTTPIYLLLVVLGGESCLLEKNYWMCFWMGILSRKLSACELCLSNLASVSWNGQLSRSCCASFLEKYIFLGWLLVEIRHQPGSQSVAIFIYLFIYLLHVSWLLWLTRNFAHMLLCTPTSHDLAKDADANIDYMPWLPLRNNNNIGHV